MIFCPRCTKRGKTWNGSDPKCGFQSGWFNEDNWCCATLAALQQLAYEKDLVKWAGVGCDEKLAVFPVELDDGNEPRYFGFLVLAWYKHRGRIGRAVFMQSDELITAPTYDLCDRVLKEHGL